MRWLTPDELSAWLVYVATTSLLDGALDRQLQRESGMPMAYYLILAMLSDVPGRTLRMSDLAAVTQSSQSRLSHAVSKLERNGWVRAHPLPRRPAQHPRPAHRRGLRGARGRPRPGTSARCAGTCSTGSAPSRSTSCGEIFATVLDGLTRARCLCRPC